MGFFTRSAPANSAPVSEKKGAKTATPATPATKEVKLTPPPGVKPSKKWTYDEAQLKMIEELKEYTATLLLPETDEYYPWEKRFLDDVGTHARFMRASKWKLDNAKQRIKGTIEWRREFRPELIEPGDVSIEAETGKIIITGFDKDARPIIYMRPGRENTATSPRQIRHLIYNLERAIDVMPEGQEQVAIVVDYKSATSSNTPSISTGLKVLHILQNHYVERLGRGLVVNMPWWINAFFSGITPFMDPITRDKIRFNPKLTELIDPEELDVEYGGSYNFDFDHSVYWPTLTEFCCLAPDGTRVDRDGEAWVPPSGNGATWALEQRVEEKSNGTLAEHDLEAKKVDEQAVLADSLAKTTIDETAEIEATPEMTPETVTDTVTETVAPSPAVEEKVVVDAPAAPVPAADIRA